MEAIAIIMIVFAVLYGMYNERSIFDIICGVVLIIIGIFLALTVVGIPIARSLAKPASRFLERADKS